VRNQRAQALITVAAAASAAAVVGLASEMTALPARQLHGLAAGLSVAFVAVLAWSHRDGVWTPSAAYLAVFWVFHFGAVTLAALGGLPDNALSHYAASWFFSDSGDTAVVLALMGLLAATTGAGLGRLGKGLRRPRISAAADQRFTRLSTTAGAALLLLGTFTWYGLIVVVGGRRLLFSSYVEYLAAVSPYNWLLGFTWLMIGWGIVLVVSAPPSRSRRVGLIALGVLAITALGTGLRGDLLFPLVAAGVVRAKGGRPLSLKVTAVAVVVGLLAISALQTLRLYGIRQTREAQVTASIASGLQELGMSLRPVERAVVWRESGEPLRLGSSYWAPLDRALVYVVPGWERPPAARDMRLMNVLVQQRVGMIGFSPVAESYLNFGVAGVLAVMLLLGFVLGRFDQLPVTRLHQVTVGLILVPLLVNVRNSFAEVPAHLVLSIALILLMVVVSKRPVVHRHRPVAPRRRLA
jgi:hypothetical protein